MNTCYGLFNIKDECLYGRIVLYCIVLYCSKNKNEFKYYCRINKPINPLMV